jgi:hypothetical protein
MPFRGLAGLVLLVGAWGAVQPPGAAAQYSPRGRPKFSLGEPRFYASLGAGSGSLRYLCDLCTGSRPPSNLTITGILGLQFAEGTVLAGLEGTFYTGKREGFTLIAASATGLALHRRLMLGAGFGFAGYRFPTLYVPWDSAVVVQGGQQSTWGLGAEVHAGLRLPIGRGLAITPQASYSTSFGNIVQFAVPTGGSLITGYADFAVLTFSVGVLWSQR